MIKQYFKTSVLIRQVAHAGYPRALSGREGFMNRWKLFGGLALATFVAGLLINLQDIRRYIKISTM
jgi:hypothetical protein